MTIILIIIKERNPKTDDSEKVEIFRLSFFFLMIKHWEWWWWPWWLRVFDKNLLSFQGRSLDFLTSHQHCRIRLKFHGDHWHRWVQVNSCDGVSLSGWWIVGTNSLWQWAHNSIHSIGLIEEMVEKNAMSSISQENVTERLNEKGEWLRARERNGGYMF